MIDPALLERAEWLGAAASYTGADGQRRSASEAALRYVCEILECGARPDTESEPPYDVVVLVRGGILQKGANPARTPIRVDWN